MKLAKILIVAAIALGSSLAFAAGAPNGAALQSRDRMRMIQSPNFTFIEGMKSNIGLPGKGEIIYGQQLSKFEDWQSTHRKALLLYPEYVEPIIVYIDENTQQQVSKKEDLEVFEARFAFVVNKPIESFNPDKVLSVELLSAMDPTIGQTEIQASQVRRNYDPINDSQGWCTSGDTLCLESTFELSMVPRKMVEAYNSTQKKPMPTTITLQSESRFNSDQESARVKMNRSYAVSVSQRVFFINHFFQYGINHVVFHRISENSTLVVGLMAIGIEQDFLDKGADSLGFLPEGLTVRSIVLNGLPTGILTRGIENGLIYYSQEMAKNLRDLLEQ